MKKMGPAAGVIVIVALLSVSAAGGEPVPITPQKPIVLFISNARLNGKDASNFYTWLKGHGRADPDRVSRWSMRSNVPASNRPVVEKMTAFLDQAHVPHPTDRRLPQCSERPCTQPAGDGL